MEIIDLVRSARVDDPIWGELPGIEACLRRLYGFISYDANGVRFPGILTAAHGAAYLPILREAIREHARRLSTHRKTDLAHTCGILMMLDGILSVS